MGYDHITDLLTRLPQLQECAADIHCAVEVLSQCYRQGGKLLICGNGGSCADAQHIVGELMKGFLKRRSLSASQKDAMVQACPAIPAHLLDELQGALPAISL